MQNNTFHQYYKHQPVSYNENKTKYMEVTKASINSDHLRCGKYEFEHVKDFNCLGSQLNQTNSTNS